MAKPSGSSNPWRGGSGGGFMVAQKRTSCLGCDPNCCPDRDQTSEEFRHLFRGRKKNSNTRPQPRQAEIRFSTATCFLCFNAWKTNNAIAQLKLSERMRTNRVKLQWTLWTSEKLVQVIQTCQCMCNMTCHFNMWNMFLFLVIFHWRG